MPRAKTNGRNKSPARLLLLENHRRPADALALEIDSYLDTVGGILMKGMPAYLSSVVFLRSKAVPPFDRALEPNPLCRKPLESALRV